MSKQYSVVANIIAKTDSFVKGINDAKSKAETFAKGFSEKTKRLGESLNNVGTNVSKYVTTPLIGLGTIAGVTFANFDDAMRKVEATMGDKLGKTTTEVEKNVKALREEAKRLGSTTAFSASEAAAGMEKLALAGWDTNQILAATEPMLNLASAAAMNLDSAADIVTDTMSAFGLSADQATKVTDIFAKTMSSSNTDVTQLGEAMKYVGSAANAAGMDLEQANAILGKLADAGLKGSTGGTVLAGMLREVQAKAKNGKIAIGDMAVSVYDANGNMRDMTSILADVEKATAGMNDEQRNAALSAIWGAEAMRGVNIILEQGTDSVRDLENALRSSDGTAQSMKDTMEGGVGGAFRSLKSSAEGLAISFGEVLAPYIKKAAEFLTSINQKFTNLDSRVKTVIVIVGGLVAAIGPLLMTLGFISTGFSVLASVIGAISAPVLIAVGVITGLVTALTLAYNKSETFRNKVNEVFQSVGSIISIVVGTTTEFFKEKISQIKQFWDENGQQILQAFQNIFNGIMAVINFVMPAVQVIIQTVLETVKDLFDGALNAIMGAVKIFAGLFTGDFSKMWEGVKQLFSGAVQFVWNLLNLSFFGRIGTGIKNFVTNSVAKFTDFFNKTKNIFTNLKNKVWDIVSGWIKNVITKVTELYTKGSEILNKFKATGEKIFSTVFSKIKEIFGNIYTTVTTKISNMVTSVKTHFNNILTTAKNIFEKVKTKITSPIENARDTVLKIIEKIKGAFAKLKIDIPKPKLPHIDVSWKKFGIGDLSVKVPNFKLNWYKTGGFFDQPSVVGLGEAGREAILPLENKKYMAPFADAVFERLRERMLNKSVHNSTNNHQEITLHNNFHFEVNGNMTNKQMNEIAKFIINKQNNMLKSKGIKLPIK